ncbi:methyltransferase [Solemya pervernicosa gill symbiont]|uniref:Methyltransferase n=2 Tax=Gammaproteobacteria incertae sedis TaxID=118884 RepID=A0A1T2L1B6_9GAMM|nr:class I SAM-dependent methyltransferase [Candidatus Reidiella endopervernicosa]OOZ38889.1 methyltransferase [Solemya pervernicosa gill symbiont]QKQ27899.1 class I SAM-dependent methyltransferase [Candidatus Reidiella endopervernicosa]
MLIEFIDFSSLILNDLQAQRLFHGRGHAYPGYGHINVDWLPPAVLITLYREEPHTNLLQLAEALSAKLPGCESVQVQYRCRPKAPYELLWGNEVLDLVANEDGLNYQLRLGSTQNSGLFLDMRNGREWVRKHAQGKNVLNLFAYTCAFSVAALAGGAKSVLNIDVSKAALSRGRDNHRLNKQDLTRVKFEGIDIFKSFSRIKKRGPFDLLICDPPSLQKGSVNIERDYKKIIRRIPEFISPGSLLMLCLNSPDLSDQFLLDTVAEECPSCRFMHRLANPEVFKEAEAGKGLKVLLFEYLPTPDEPA